MTPQLIIGFITEGSTDYRFLESVIQRTFEEVAFDCDGQIEILPVQYLEKKTGDFNSQIEQHAQKAYEIGISVLCIHTDADSDTDSDTFSFKIIPAFNALKVNPNEKLCKNLVPIVPIQMIEAWMLADKELLKNEIGTQKTDVELGIHKTPESMTDPKQVIQEAIRIGRQDLAKKRRRDLSIVELYQIIGSTVNIDKLNTLPSFRKFKGAVRNALKDLNYLR